VLVGAIKGCDRIVKEIMQRSIAKKRYPCTRTRRLTSALPVKTLAELFAAMVTDGVGLNIQTE